MKIILIGPPGSGKGTLAEKLTDELELPHVSSGDVLRAEVAAGTNFGNKIKYYMDRGEIGPVELITEVILNFLDTQCRSGFILDGFPRTIYQAEELSARHNINAAIFLDVTEEEIIGRITGRRICRGCNGIYHISNKPPAVPDKCDICGEELYQRSDDTADTVRNRIKVYNDETKPVIDYYRDSGILKVVSADKDPDAILTTVLEILDLEAAGA